MKLQLLALAAFAITLASCGERMSVTDYNQKVIGIYNPIDQKISMLEGSVTAAGGNVSQAVASIQSCVKSVDSGLAEVKKLEAPEKAKAMQSAVVALMTYERDTMLPVLEKMVKADGDVTKLTALEGDLTGMATRASALTNTMQAEQQKLAASVGAKVEN